MLSIKSELGLSAWSEPIFQYPQDNVLQPTGKGLDKDFSNAQAVNLAHDINVMTASQLGSNAANSLAEQVHNYMGDPYYYSTVISNIEKEINAGRPVMVGFDLIYGQFTHDVRAYAVNPAPCLFAPPSLGDDCEHIMVMDINLPQAKLQHPTAS